MPSQTETAGGPETGTRPDSESPAVRQAHSLGQTLTSFIDNSIEAGILLGGNDSLSHGEWRQRRPSLTVTAWPGAATAADRTAVTVTVTVPVAFRLTGRLSLRLGAAAR